MISGELSVAQVRNREQELLSFGAYDEEESHGGYKKGSELILEAFGAKGKRIIERGSLRMSSAVDVLFGLKGCARGHGASDEAMQSHNA